MGWAENKSRIDEISRRLQKVTGVRWAESWYGGLVTIYDVDSDIPVVEKIRLLPEDAEFIACSREDVEWLKDRVLVLEKELRELRELTMNRADNLDE